jgi:hypothetical protein
MDLCRATTRRSLSNQLIFFFIRGFCLAQQLAHAHIFRLFTLLEIQKHLGRGNHGPGLLSIARGR